jgi:Na+/alanine symporter
VGSAIVAISLVMFAFTTILGWCVYGERSAIFLFGDRVLKPFRILYTIVVPIGALAQLLHPLDQQGNAAGPVQQGIFGMDMQVDKGH